MATVRVVQVWVAEVTYIDTVKGYTGSKKNVRRSRVHSFDTEAEAIAWLNQPEILRLLGSNRDNRGNYWNMMGNPIGDRGSIKV